MKIFIWLGFFVLAAFWTGLVAVTEQLTQWLLTAMANGQVGELAGLAGQWPVPAWAGFWVDTEWLQSVQLAAVDLVQWLGQVMPSSQGLMSWISPLLWLGWGLGTLVLLAGAVIGHLLVGKRQRALRQSVRF